MPDVQLLKVRVRDRIASRVPDGLVNQIVEVVKDGEVIGQLPVTSVTYEMRPNGLGSVKFELIAERAEVDSLA